MHVRNTFTLAMSSNMFYTVFHETRHMRGENHSGDEFDDWETFLQDSCPDSSKR